MVELEPERLFYLRPTSRCSIFTSFVRYLTQIFHCRSGGSNSWTSRRNYVRLRFTIPSASRFHQTTFCLSGGFVRLHIFSCCSALFFCRLLCGLELWTKQENLFLDITLTFVIFLLRIFVPHQKLLVTYILSLKNWAILFSSNNSYWFKCCRQKVPSQGESTST
jgi:hypothetical protein